MCPTAGKRRDASPRQVAGPEDQSQTFKRTIEAAGGEQLEDNHQDLEMKTTTSELVRTNEERERAQTAERRSEHTLIRLGKKTSSKSKTCNNEQEPAGGIYG